MAILQQQLLTDDEIILLLDCFSVQCKRNNDDHKIGRLKGNFNHGRYTVPVNICQSLPLNLEMINNSLRPAGFVLPATIFVLWSKRCW